MYKICSWSSFVIDQSNYTCLPDIIGSPEFVLKNRNSLRMSWIHGEFQIFVSNPFHDKWKLRHFSATSWSGLSLLANPFYQNKCIIATPFFSKSTGPPDSDYDSVWKPWFRSYFILFGFDKSETWMSLEVQLASKHYYTDPDWDMTIPGNDHCLLTWTIAKSHERLWWSKSDGFKVSTKFLTEPLYHQMSRSSSIMPSASFSKLPNWWSLGVPAHHTKTYLSRTPSFPFNTERSRPCGCNLCICNVMIWTVGLQGADIAKHDSQASACPVLYCTYDGPGCGGLSVSSTDPAISYKPQTGTLSQTSPLSFDIMS